MKNDTIKRESLYMKAWQKAINLKGSAANMAANVERRQLLRCWVEYTIATERGYQVPSWVRTKLMVTVAATASSDLKALLPAIPTSVLVSAIGRAMTAELAANDNTAVAVAQAAQKAMAEARHEAQKAAKKAALAAKKAAKKAAADYVTNNTCGQI